MRFMLFFVVASMVAAIAVWGGLGTLLLIEEHGWTGALGGLWLVSGFGGLAVITWRHFRQFPL